MAKRDDPAQKLARKRHAWLERTTRIFNLPEADALALLRTPRVQSIRINPLRGEPAQTMQALRTLGSTEPYDWMPLGVRTGAPMNVLRDHELVKSGKVFIQNAASWLPVLALDPGPGESILDVCAAPGGKGSHIAALTNNQVQLTANDNSRPRLAKLRATFDRLGVANAHFTLYDATQLVRKLNGQQFDRILLDAPCSGEGMMHYDRTQDFATWSVAHIKRLQQLQKRLLTQAWQLLKPGGILIYSTCTMAPEENEAVIDYLLRTHAGATLESIPLLLPNQTKTIAKWNDRTYNSHLVKCLRLRPSTYIEAFFVAKIRKDN